LYVKNQAGSLVSVWDWLKLLKLGPTAKIRQRHLRSSWLATFVAFTTPGIDLTDLTRDFSVVSDKAVRR
jgi:hypothetical protein